MAYNELKKLSEKITVDIAQAEENNILLSQEIRLLQTDDKYIEKIIRNRLNYVKDSEILYIFPERKELETLGAATNATKN